MRVHKSHYGQSKLVRRCAVVGLATALSVALAACGEGTEQGAQGGHSGGSKKVTVRLALLAEGYDAPAFYAKKLGYFKKAGFDVALKESTGSSTTTKLVGNGKADIGFADLATVAKGVAEGVPVKAIGSVFQKTPLATIYVPGRGISKPKDLAGKTVADEPQTATSAYFSGFLDQTGVSKSDLKTVSVQAAGREKALATGRVDAFNSYAAEEIPIIESALHTKAAAFNWNQHGLHMLGMGIIASNSTIKNDPGMLHKFVGALAKGYVAAAKNPKAASQAVLDSYSHAGGGSLQAVEGQWKRSESLQHSSATQGKPLFWMSPSAWKSTMAVNAKYRDVKDSGSANNLYTNDFVNDTPKPKLTSGTK